IDSGSTGTVRPSPALPNSVAPFATRPRVTAGLMCAPDAKATTTPAKTAKPQPNVTMRNPPLKPFVFARATLATTPQPMSTSIAVPTSSERNNLQRSSTLTFHPFRLARGLRPGAEHCPPYSGHAPRGMGAHDLVEGPLRFRGTSYPRPAVGRRLTEECCVGADARSRGVRQPWGRNAREEDHQRPEARRRRVGNRFRPGARRPGTRRDGPDPCGG